MHSIHAKNGLTGFSIGCICVELNSPSNILTFLQQHQLYPGRGKQNPSWLFIPPPPGEWSSLGTASCWPARSTCWLASLSLQPINSGGFCVWLTHSWMLVSTSVFSCLTGGALRRCTIFSCSLRCGPRGIRGTHGRSGERITCLRQFGSRCLPSCGSRRQIHGSGGVNNWNICNSRSTCVHLEWCEHLPPTG